MSGEAGGPNTKHKVPSSTGSGHGAGDPICIDIDIDNRQNVESTASKRDVNEDMEIATVLASHSQAPPSIDHGCLPSHKASIYPWNSSPGRRYISQHTSLHSNDRYHARHCDSEDEPHATSTQVVDAMKPSVPRGTASQTGSPNTEPGETVLPVSPSIFAGRSGSTARGRVASSMSTYNPEHESGTDNSQRLNSLYGDFRMLRSSPEKDSDDDLDEDEDDSSQTLSREGRPSSRATRDFRDVTSRRGDDGFELRPELSARSFLSRSTTQAKPARSRHSALEPESSSSDSSSRQSPSPYYKNRYAFSKLQTSRRRASGPPGTNHERSRRGTKTSFHDHNGSRHGSDPSDRFDTSVPDGSTARRRASKRPQRHENVDNSTERQVQMTCNSDVREVNIPKADSARGRRLLAPSDRATPVITIAMRGDASFIDQRQLFRISAYSLPFYDRVDTPAPRVADACLLEDDTAIFGYESGPCQVSVIPLNSLDGDQRPRRVDLGYRAHTTVQERSGMAYPNLGISTLAPVAGPELRFLSGGYDKSIHLWTVRRNDGNFSARSQRLKIIHTQKVNAAAYRAHDQKVFSGAGKQISVMSLGAHVAPDPIRVSDGPILQVHIHPQHPPLVLLEVDHMDRQVLLYDTRKAGFDRPPCLEFGFRDTSSQRRTRYTKGSTSHNFFVRPYGDGEKGTVRMWDYRNSDNVVTCFHSVRPAPVVHAVLSGSDVIAYGGHSVTIWKNSRNAD